MGQPNPTSAMTTNAKFGTNCVKQSSVSLPFLEHEILFCVRVYRVFVWECIGCEYRLWEMF